MLEDQCRLLQKILENSRAYFIIRSNSPARVYEVTKVDFSNNRLIVNGWTYHVGESDRSYGDCPDAPPAFAMGYFPARSRDPGSKHSDIVGFFYENPLDNPNAKPIMAFDAAKYN